MGYDISSSLQTVTYTDEEEFSSFMDGLYKNDERARFNVDAWPRLLHLAETYGWNDGQIVTAHDAAMLADALERALPDLPDHEIKGKFVNVTGKRSGNSFMDIITRALEGDAETVVYGPNTDMHPFEYFGGAMKKKVESFIRLCRKGEFAIW